MELVAWFVLGALAGYVSGVAIFEDEGIGVSGHVLVGSIAGIVGGFAVATFLGIANPFDLFSPETAVGAVVTAALAVILVNSYAERAQLEI